MTLAWTASRMLSVHSPMPNEVWPDVGNFPQSGRVGPECPDGLYREILVGQYREVISQSCLWLCM